MGKQITGHFYEKGVPTQRAQVATHVAGILTECFCRSIMEPWAYNVLYNISGYRVFINGLPPYETEKNDSPDYIKIVLTPRYRSTDRYKRGLDFSPAQILNSIAHSLGVKILEFHIPNLQEENFWILIRTITQKDWIRIK